MILHFLASKQLGESRDFFLEKIQRDFEDSRTFHHAMISDEFEALWNNHAHRACFQILLNSLRNRVASLLSALDFNDHHGFIILAKFLSNNFDEKVERLRDWLALPEHEQCLRTGKISETYDSLIETLSQITQPYYEHEPTEYSLFYHVIVGQYNNEWQVEELSSPYPTECSGLIHDLGLGRLALGKSLQQELKCEGYTPYHWGQSSTEEIAQVISRFYRLYPSKTGDTSKTMLDDAEKSRRRVDLLDRIHH